MNMFFKKFKIYIKYCNGKHKPFVACGSNIKQPMADKKNKKKLDEK